MKRNPIQWYHNDTQRTEKFLVPQVIIVGSTPRRESGIGAAFPDVLFVKKTLFSGIITGGGNLNVSEWWLPKPSLELDLASREQKDGTNITSRMQPINMTRDIL